MTCPLDGLLVADFSRVLATGIPPVRLGNRHPSIAPYESLRCADTALAVACGDDGQFRRLAAAVGAPALADEPRFATNPERVRHCDDLTAELEARLAGATAQEWAQRLTSAGVPAGVVGDIGTAIERAIDLGLDPLVDVGGRSSQIRHPILYADATTATPVPPPVLGEHTTDLRAWLTGPARPLPPRTAGPKGI